MSDPIGPGDVDGSTGHTTSDTLPENCRVMLFGKTFAFWVELSNHIIFELNMEQIKCWKSLTRRFADLGPTSL